MQSASWDLRLSSLAVSTLGTMSTKEPSERAPAHPMGDFATQYDVEFRNLQFSVPSKKGGKPHTLILKGVSGYCRSARLTAIMGASGAGEHQQLRSCVWFSKTPSLFALSWVALRAFSDATCHKTVFDKFSFGFVGQARLPW